MNINNLSEIDKLAIALLSWLNYIYAVNRSLILSESSLKIPIVDYLLSVNVTDLNLEFSHPYFKRRRIDLLYRTKEENVLPKRAFEFKYVKNESTKKTAEKQRILNDILRLYFLDKDTQGYFLITGKEKDFLQDFKDLPLEEEINNTYSGIVKIFYEEWFSFDINNPEREINLNTTDINYSSFYVDFENEYKKDAKNQFQMPQKVKTKLVYLSEKKDNLLSIGIWEILK